MKIQNIRLKCRKKNDNVWIFKTHIKLSYVTVKRKAFPPKTTYDDKKFIYLNIQHIIN